MDFDLGWAVKNQKSILERWAALMAGNGVDRKNSYPEIFPA